MNRTLKLFGRFFVFALVITMFSLALVTFSSTTVSAEGSFVFTSHSELGVVSNDVLELQILLNSKGYNVGIPDGKFGVTTKEQVILFQKANGLTPDGIIGQGVRAFLNGTSTTITPTPKITTTPKITPTALTTTSTTPTSLNRTLKLLIPRMNGADVKDLQTFLNNKGYDVGIPDGYFGPKTQSAVILFQTANNLTPDGSVGPMTKALMGNSFTSSTSGCTSSLGFSTITGQSCASTSIVSTLGCASGALFNTTTGQSCTTILPAGCTSGALFNTTTGASCGTLSVLPAGCTASSLFSTTSGVSCSNVLPTTPIIRSGGGGGGGGGGSSSLIQLTITNPTLTTSKEYDRTTTAVVTAGSLVSVVLGDSVTVSAVANYDSVNIGTNKTITVVYTLSGANAGKYTKPIDRVVYSGIITTKQLTIADPDLTLSKLYDTNTTAVITPGALIGVAGTEDVTVTAVATYTGATVATGKTITVVYTISGAEITNYIKPVNYTTTQGVITTIQLTIANPTSLITSKKYGGSTSTVVTLGALSGVISPDDVTVSAVANFDTQDVGTDKPITVVYTLAGGSSANYIKPVDYTTTGEIIAAAAIPSSITLAVGGTAPVGGVVNVAIPQPDATDTTGVVTGWVVTTADMIKFTVVDAGFATSTITINGGVYTSGANYKIVPTTSLPIIVVTTTEADVATAVRTFIIAGPIVGSDTLTYGVVVGADGKRWLDRNLGASRVATSATDWLAFGSLFQWGRGADGHQSITRTSATAATADNGSTDTLSVTDTPGDNLFIKAPTTPFDWRSTKNDNLWQGVNGTNNVCPAGFRLPTNTEQQTLITAAGITKISTAFSSSLKLTAAGYRFVSDASLGVLGTYGSYWSSSVSGTSALNFGFNASTVYPANVSNRALGFSVRCLKD